MGLHNGDSAGEGQLRPSIDNKYQALVNILCHCCGYWAKVSGNYFEKYKTLNWLFHGGDFCIFVFNNNWGINRVWLCAHVAIFMQYHWIKSVCHCSSNFRALTSPRAYWNHWQMTWMMPGWGHYRMENLDNMMKKARSIDEGGRWRHHAPVPMVGRSWLRSGAQVCWYYIQTDALHAHRALYRHCTDTVHCQGSSITPWLSCPGHTHQATSVLVRTSKTLRFKEKHEWSCHQGSRRWQSTKHSFSLIHPDPCQGSVYISA